MKTEQTRRRRVRHMMTGRERLTTFAMKIIFPVIFIWFMCMDVARWLWMFLRRTLNSMIECMGGRRGDNVVNNNGNDGWWKIILSLRRLSQWEIFITFIFIILFFVTIITRGGYPYAMLGWILFLHVSWWVNITVIWVISRFHAHGTDNVLNQYIIWIGVGVVFCLLHMMFFMGAIAGNVHKILVTRGYM